MAIVNAFPMAQGGGGGDIDALVGGTIESYTGNVTYVKSYAFYFCSSLTYASLSKCESMNSNAFAYCSALSFVYIPKVSQIQNSTFIGCNSLKSVVTDAYDFGTDAFRYCSNLESLITASSAPSDLSFAVANFAFDSCSKLAVFPSVLTACTSILSAAFNSCNKMAISGTFPKCTTIGSNAFANCSSATSLSFPVVEVVSTGAFAGCINLTSLRLGSISTIQSSTFRNTKFSSFYLTSATKYRNAIVTLTNSNAFSSASCISTSGKIYVPSNFLTSYKAATNWTYWSNRIFSSTTNA